MCVISLQVMHFALPHHPPPCPGVYLGVPVSAFHEGHLSLVNARSQSQEDVPPNQEFPSETKLLETQPTFRDPLAFAG